MHPPEMDTSLLPEGYAAVNNYRKIIMEKYLTITEFVKLKGVSRQSVHSLINSNRLDTKVMFGKRLIVNNKKAKDYQPNPGRRTDLK